jgi:ribose transport system permease protein
MRRPRVSMGEIAERGGLPLFLVVLIVFFAIDATTTDAFKSHANVMNLLRNQSVTAIAALAMVIPLVCGYFDLSVAGVLGASNVAVAAIVGTHGGSIIVGIIVALIIGALIGAFNGWLIAYLRLNGFIVTLAVYTLLGGLLLLYTRGQTIISGIPLSVSNWGAANWFGIPRTFIVLVIVALVLWYLLMQTPFGRQLEGLGSSESAARLVGIPVERRVFGAFVISGTLAAIAGVVLTATAGNADPNAGPAYLFPALAAVFLGATSIRPGRYNVWGTIIGVFFVAVAVNGLTLLGANTWVTPVFNGGSLLVAVAVSTFLGRHRANQAVSVDHKKSEAPNDEQVMEGNEMA